MKRLNHTHLRPLPQPGRGMVVRAAHGGLANVWSLDSGVVSRQWPLGQGHGQDGLSDDRLYHADWIQPGQGGA